LINLQTKQSKHLLETKACTAVQLLVALLPMRNKKGVNAIEYIYYAKEVNVFQCFVQNIPGTFTSLFYILSNQLHSTPL
jgi:hypothetical protein